MWIPNQYPSSSCSWNHISCSIMYLMFVETLKLKGFLDHGNNFKFNKIRASVLYKPDVHLSFYSFCLISECWSAPMWAIEPIGTVGIRYWFRFFSSTTLKMEIYTSKFNIIDSLSAQIGHYTTCFLSYCIRYCFRPCWISPNRYLHCTNKKEQVTRPIDCTSYCVTKIIILKH